MFDVLDVQHSPDSRRALASSLLMVSLKKIYHTAGVRAPPSYLGVFRAPYGGTYGKTKVKMKVLAHSHKMCAKVWKKALRVLL